MDPARSYRTRERSVAAFVQAVEDAQTLRSIVIGRQEQEKREE